MAPTAYEFVHAGPAPALVDIYLPATFQSAALVVAAGAIGALLLVVQMRRTMASGGAVSQIARVWPYVLLIVIYHFRWNHVDEVAIALEHAFNLHHFGLFSYAPDRLVDGTVEFAYYLVLAPFAWSAQSVVVANYLLGMIVAVAHLYLLSRLVAREPAATRTAVLLLFSVNYPIVVQLAGGFGNPLVTLGMLIAIDRHWSGRRGAAALIAGVLPLLRPDAVLYSIALLYAFADRTAPRWWVRWLGRATVPLAATLLYFALFRWFHGHWIPTPIAFKSPALASFGLAQARLVAGHALSTVTLPHVLALFAVVGMTRWRGDPRIATLRRLLWPMAGIWLFYQLAGSDRDATGINAARYWLGFDLTLALCTSVAVVRWLAPPPGGIVRGLVPATVVACAVGAATWTPPTVSSNRSELGYAGQIVAAAVPRELSLATTELNGFGLAVPDREVIDLWGYTRPEIARSPLRDDEMNRYEPALFQALQPDLFFVYDMDGTADAEAQLGGVSVRHGVARLGDMHRILRDYDLVSLHHPQQAVVLLVRRDSLGALRRSLDASGYRQASQRPIDMELFGRYYRQPGGVR